MASNNIARLGVVLGLDTASWSADIDKAIAENRKLGLEIKRATNAAAAEILNLKYATEDYGKEVSKVTQIEREIQAGRFTKALPEEIAMLRKAAQAYDDVAKAKKTSFTGGLTAQQQQALAYQTTDLVTQIASGQNAMIALLQQGGQLKDQFGGFANTFKMLSTVITPMRLAIGGVTAALGVLGFAFIKGQQESAKLRDDLILTGNYADMTQKKFFDLAQTTSQKLGVSVGDAKDVFGQLVASGKFTGQSIDAVGEAILRVAQLSGKTAEEMSGQLIPMFNGTASSAKQLNDQYHFLSLEQYKQIELLEKQGKGQEAADLYAKALNEKLSSQKRELGDLEKAWKKVKEMASSTWEAMLNIGRAESEEEKLAKLTKFVVDAATALGKANPESVFYDKLNEGLQKFIQDRDRLIAEMEAKKAASKEGAEQTKAISLYEKAGGYAKEVSLKNEYDKLRIKNSYDNAIAETNIVNQIYLEAEREKALARKETEQKNIEENYVFQERNAKILAEKIVEIERAKQLKLRQIRLNETLAAEQLKQQNEDEQTAEIVRKDELYKSIVKNNQVTIEGLNADQRKLELQEKLIGASSKEAALESLRLKYEEQRRKLRENTDLSDDRKNILERQINQAEEIEKANIAIQDSIVRTGQVHDAVFGNMISSIEQFVRTGKMSFKDLARNIIQDMLLIYMRAQALRLFGMLGQIGTAYAYGTNIGSEQTNMLYQQEYGLKASGGPVESNTPYIVGERGPELFMPRSAGTIIPNNALSSVGGQTVVNNYNIQAIDVKSFEQRLMGSSKAIWAANQYAQKGLAVTPGRM